MFLLYGINLWSQNCLQEKKNQILSDFKGKKIHKKAHRQTHFCQFTNTTKANKIIKDKQLSNHKNLLLLFCLTHFGFRFYSKKNKSTSDTGVIIAEQQKKCETDIRFPEWTRTRGWLICVGQTKQNKKWEKNKRKNKETNKCTRSDEFLFFPLSLVSVLPLLFVVSLWVC